MNCVQITNPMRPLDWKTKVKINATDKNNKIDCVAVFDTGAQCSSISRKLFESINADVIEKTVNHGTTGDEITEVCRIDIELYHGCTIKDCYVTILSNDIGCDVLIGMNVITLGDFHSFRDSDGLYKCTFSLYP